jgi:hypothetical protein
MIIGEIKRIVIDWVWGLKNENVIGDVVFSDNETDDETDNENLIEIDEIDSVDDEDNLIDEIDSVDDEDNLIDNLIDDILIDEIDSVDDEDNLIDEILIDEIFSDEDGNQEEKIIPTVFGKYRDLSCYKTQQGKQIIECFDKKCFDWGIFNDNIDIGNEDENDGKRNYGKGNGGSRNHGKESSVREVVVFKEKNLLLQGRTQSGKTGYIICNACHHIVLGFSPIILLRCSISDRIQTVNRIREFIIKNGFDKYQIHFKFLDEFSDIDMCEMIDILSGKTPTIIVTLAHETPLKKITDVLKHVEHPLITLLIDEVDNVSSTDSVVVNPMVENLRDLSKQTIGISATIMSTAVEWNLPGHCIRIFGKPKPTDDSCYIGTEDISYVEKDTGYKTIHNKDDIESIFEKVPCLKDFLKEIASDPLESNFVKQQASVSLVCLSYVTGPPMTMFNYMKKSHSNVASVFMNKNGIKLCHPSLIDPITIKVKGKGEITSKINENTHSFSNKVGVSMVLSYLESQDIIQRVVIFAGRGKCGRAISFSSDIKNITNYYGKYRWHVGKMLLRLRDSNGDFIPDNNIIQFVGRLTGCFRPGTKQTLYANFHDLEVAQKAYTFQEDLRNRSLVNSNENLGKFIPEDKRSDHLVKTTLVSNFKIRNPGKTRTGRAKTSNRKLDSRGSIKPQTVDDDGCGDTEKDFVPVEIERIPIAVLPDVEFNIIDFRKKFVTLAIKWSSSQNTTRIAQFMKSIEPEKIYSGLEIMDLALKTTGKSEEPTSRPEAEKLVSHCSSGGQGGYCYGKILNKTEDGNFHLHTELVESFKTHFGN